MDNEAQGRALGEWYVKMYEAYRAMGDDDQRHPPMFFESAARRRKGPTRVRQRT